MWRAPNRPTHEVSQPYNDGYVTVYVLTDSAEPGSMPVETLTKRVGLHYAEQRMGITRYYAAAQANAQIERVIRVQRRPDINAQDVAITEDGVQYRINLVQSVPDVYPASLDLTLSRVTQKYEVM